MLALAGEELGELGGHIRTAGTKRTVQDGKTRVLRSQLEVGLPVPMSAIQAAIIVPLKMGFFHSGYVEVLLSQAFAHF